jgi:hypothetical protein
MLDFQEILDKEIEKLAKEKAMPKVAVVKKAIGLLKMQNNDEQYFTVKGGQLNENK